jgi:hypothetical protein
MASTTTIEPYDAAAHAEIVANLRPIDRDEWQAWSHVMTPDELAASELSFWAQPPARAQAWIARVDGRPAAFIGFAPCLLDSSTASIGCYGTDDWPAAVRRLTRWAEVEFRAAMREVGFTHAQALVFAKHAEARRWIKWFGGEEREQDGEFILMKGMV